ncbi:hypothetical protein [Paenibacillus sp. DMB5]|uniref:hypothetical protein n=1 Tax=Paenibacillus sp. DMB5 TaxID=1780103 RepID=UPI00076C835B|nr:hypothetical protein [Paenibacillus sp. DMB5]KUP25786.1 hypothetical protein AWJ19_19370 [Paenibacillus sp. DMB5]
MATEVEILDTMEIAEVLYFQFRHAESNTAVEASSRVIEELRDKFYNSEAIYRAAIMTQLLILNNNNRDVYRYFTKYIDKRTLVQITHQLNLQPSTQSYVSIIRTNVEKVEAMKLGH